MKNLKYFFLFLQLIFGSVAYSQSTSGPEIEVFSSDVDSAFSANFTEGTKLFSDRNYILSKLPSGSAYDEFDNLIFLRGKMGGLRFRTKSSGRLTILTPSRFWSTHSQDLSLFAAGFKVRSNLQFQLFGVNSSDKVRVLDKNVQAGEYYELGSWAVVVGVKSISSVSLDDYLKAPLIKKAPGSPYNVRIYQGIPSIAKAANGRLWAAWYGGGRTEDQGNYVIISSSGDEGRTWTKEQFIIDPDGNGRVRAFDPEVWIDPDGKIWIFWAQEAACLGKNNIDYWPCGNSLGGVWAISGDSRNTTPTWSAPRRLSDGVMMNKPLVLSTGEWVLPVSTSRCSKYKADSAKMLVSINKGLTWSHRGAVNNNASDGSDEHMIVELSKNNLWMLVRTKNGIDQSSSNDNGFTWSTLSRSTLPRSIIPHPVSRFFISSLKDGRLILIKHGDVGTRYDSNTGRSHLMAFISSNKGQTWNGGLLIDSRSEISYPDGVVDSQGNVYMTYDRGRKTAREILMQKFTLSDILQGAGRDLTGLHKMIDDRP